MDINSILPDAELLQLMGGTDPFAAAVRVTHMPMTVSDPRQPDNPVVFANDAFCRLTGYAREEVLGRNCRFLQGPCTDTAAVARLRAAIAAAEPVEIDIQNHRMDGQAFWNRLKIAPVRNASGALVYFMASQVDVTAERERLAGLESRNAALMAELADRLRAQEQSEARLRELIATLDLAAIMVRDMDGAIRFWSRGCERLYGWTAGEAVGRISHELLRTEYPVPRAELEETLLREGEWRGDLRHVRRDGTFLVAAAHKVMRRDEVEGRTVVMESLADVTALRQARAELQSLNETLEARIEARTTELLMAEEQLRQAQKMEAVGQLTGGIAHDFNNMLQAIAGSIEMLQRRAAQGRAEDAERFAEGARRTVGRAAALTHRLLAFARRQALQPEHVQPDELIEGLAELIRRTVGSAIQVDLRMGDGIWTVLCDPNQLENVLLNLAINARDAMPEGGRLTILTEDVRLSAADVADQEAAPGDYVEIAVADTGMGMTPDVVARAFEPFFTTKPTGQGTGLGLSQVYGFVRQSEGFVRLESEAGKGTTVRLYLPRRDRAGGAEYGGLGGAADSSTAAGGSGTVLLVEDEADLRALAAETLRERGHAVLEAEDGPAALRHLKGKVDALVTDVGLPGGMNGRQLAEAAREGRPNLPVLFMTGYAGHVLDGELAPGMAVIGKPFALDALAVKVRTLLEVAPAA
jgi:PAS domain S-box-containing protein